MVSLEIVISTVIGIFIFKVLEHWLNSEVERRERKRASERLKEARVEWRKYEEELLPALDPTSRKRWDSNKDRTCGAGLPMSVFFEGLPIKNRPDAAFNWLGLLCANDEYNRAHKLGEYSERAEYDDCHFSLKEEIKLTRELYIRYDDESILGGERSQRGGGVKPVSILCD